MTVALFTSRISTRDPDRFDVTRKGALLWSKANGRPEIEAPSHPFAPSWDLLKAAKRGELRFDEYEPLYLAEMRVSWRTHHVAWERLLARRRVVVYCYCVDRAECHRGLLAGLLVKAGAVDGGEVS